MGLSGAGGGGWGWRVGAATRQSLTSVALAFWPHPALGYINLSLIFGVPASINLGYIWWWWYKGPPLFWQLEFIVDIPVSGHQTLNIWPTCPCASEEHSFVGCPIDHLKYQPTPHPPPNALRITRSTGKTWNNEFKTTYWYYNW